MTIFTFIVSSKSHNLLLLEGKRLYGHKKVKLKLKVDFHIVPYNQTFEFVTRQFVKILSPTCSWKMLITLNCLEYFDKILHTHWYWWHLVQEIAKWHLSLVEALPSAKFWKSENSPISWTEWNILITLHKHWYWKDLAQEIAKWHFSLPNSKFWKSENGQSLELSGILWWNFVYTLILTWCSPWDSQMTFGLVEVLRGFKFWQKWNLTLKPFGIFW